MYYTVYNDVSVHKYPFSKILFFRVISLAGLLPGYSGQMETTEEHQLLMTEFPRNRYKSAQVYHNTVLHHPFSNRRVTFNTNAKNLKKAFFYTLKNLSLLPFTFFVPFMAHILFFVLSRDFMCRCTGQKALC